MNMSIENVTRQHCVDACMRIKNHADRKEHVESGCFYITDNTYPRKYKVEYDGDFYPPKVVLRIAYQLTKNPDISDSQIAVLRDEDSPDVHGGKDTNTVLEDLEFTVTKF